MIRIDAFDSGFSATNANKRGSAEVAPFSFLRGS